MTDNVEVHRVQPESAQSEGLSPWVSLLADWLDTRYRVPGTNWRFGFDALIGLLPVAGDTFTAVVGAAMLHEAVRLKASPAVMAKMLGNLAVDWLVGLVPGADLILDVAFKAHARNAKLLANEARRVRDSQSGGERPAP